jgi:WS/DGAT/MGAT family acyltransferase
MRDVGEPVGATVNDVLLAVIAGALHRYLEERGVLPPEPLVAAVPLTIRTDEDDERSNAVTSVSVSLATDERDPSARLRLIRDAMTARKRRRGHTTGEQLMAWADVPPPFVFSLATRSYVDLGLAQRIDPICNLVVSSVPAPPASLYLGGARLLGIYPLGPIYSGMLLNITAIGCGADLHFGIVGCRKRMPDLWCLADAIPGALAELSESLRNSDAAQSRV